jgi:hypothetical protein
MFYYSQNALEIVMVLERRGGRGGERRDKEKKGEL